jgi:hypothetical protein
VLLLESASALRLRVHNGGTYVNMEGPAFSTRAESIANHEAGFDVIGMTNLGEAKCAREAEIAYATLAMVTDYDCWKGDEEHVTVEMVIDNLHKNAASAKAVVAHMRQPIGAELGNGIVGGHRHTPSGGPELVGGSRTSRDRKSPGRILRCEIRRERYELAAATQC